MQKRLIEVHHLGLLFRQTNYLPMNESPRNVSNLHLVESQDQSLGLQSVGVLSRLLSTKEEQPLLPQDLQDMTPLLREGFGDLSDEGSRFRQLPTVAYPEKTPLFKLRDRQLLMKHAHCQASLLSLFPALILHHLLGLSA